MSLETQLILLANAAVVVLIAAVLVWQARAGRRKGRVWQAFADATPGLACRGEGVDNWLEGRRHGVPVRVAVALEGAKYKHPVTIFRAACGAPLPGGLELYRQGVLAAAAKAFGGQDVEVGDPAFDAAVVVRCASEAEAKGLLADDAARAEVLRAVRAEESLTVRDGTVIARRAGRVGSAEVLSSGLEAVSGVAAALTAAAGRLDRGGEARVQAVRTYRAASGDWGRSFLVFMLAPLGLAAFVALVSPILPAPAPVRVLAALTVVAGLVLLGVRIAPRSSLLELDPATLVYQDGKGRRRAFLLGELALGYGRWVMQGVDVGVVLHLQCGDEALSIGGTQVRFDDRRRETVRTVDTPTVALSMNEFEDLSTRLVALADRARAEAAARAAADPARPA